MKNYNYRDKVLLLVLLLVVLLMSLSACEKDPIITTPPPTPYYHVTTIQVEKLDSLPDDYIVVARWYCNCEQSDGDTITILIARGAYYYNQSDWINKNREIQVHWREECVGDSMRVDVYGAGETFTGESSYAYRNIGYFHTHSQDTVLGSIMLHKPDTFRIMPTI